MQFGVFDHMDRGQGSLAELYESRLQLAEAYDRAGFYGYHVAEHHATPLGVAPSPSVFLSAVAQRTKRLRFGPLVYLLPMYHPVRLIDEICMLDQMSGGRFMLGVGRGISPVASGSSVHTQVMKTEGLRQALDAGGFDAAFGGARRDEEKSRAKERVFSFRSANHRWDPKSQRPER